MQLSIVTTLYCSKPFLGRFFEQITDEIKANGVADYEIVVVNDGSPDDSLEYCIEAKKQYPQIRIIDLSRNFGHHYALQTGLEYASGDLIYLTDNDLETPASFFSDCYSAREKDNSIELVYGVQQKRKGHFVEKIGGSIFWSVFNYFSDIKVPANILTECLMTRKFVNELLKLQDANLFLAGMIHWVGLSKKELEVKKGLREGKSTYTFKKRLQLMIQALTSFSGKPLELLFYIGLLITFGSIIFLFFLLIRKLAMGDSVSIGWTSMVGINVLSLGLISTFLGLIGLYVYRIYRQVQGRPNHIVKKIY